MGTNTLKFALFLVYSIRHQFILVKVETINVHIPR